MAQGKIGIYLNPKRLKAVPRQHGPRGAGYRRLGADQRGFYDWYGESP